MRTDFKEWKEIEWDIGLESHCDRINNETPSVSLFPFRGDRAILRAQYPANAYYLVDQILAAILIHYLDTFH
jgi:hypothetical protein